MLPISNSDLDSASVAQNPTRRINAMYATRLMTEIYHLVQPGGQHTLCGLRISRVTSDRKINTLQLVNELPPNVAICKHCERIKNQEKMNNENHTR
jgi:hypothetical protein